MVESSAKQVSEAEMLEALLKGHEAIKELIAFQNQIIADCGKEKFELSIVSHDEQIIEEVQQAYREPMLQAIQVQEKLAREEAIAAVMEEVREKYEAEYADHEDLESIIKSVNEATQRLEKEEMRKLITIDRVRPDGRQVDEIRPLASRVGILPRTHGSGLFTRGQTQALTVATLAPLGEYQVIDGLGVEEGKRFIHHYNFPPYSVGETGCLLYTSDAADE